MALLRSRPTRLLAGLLAAAAAAPAAAEAGPGDEAEAEEIVVQATRSGRSLRDEPVRVEVLGRDEIEEKLLESPGSIAMLLGETPGVQTQTVSPGLGAANIRLQGLKGRYTQLLADGLPLYGGQVPAIGLLQVPPIDLARVELIKGAASALYGPSALGGVINLVARRPGEAAEVDMVLNAMSRDGQDLAAYAAGPLGRGVGASVTGGYNRQATQDLDGDGWADLPRVRRWSLRPRLFLERGAMQLMLTVGAMGEERAGGTLPGRVVPDGVPFALALGSRRTDLGLTAEAPAGEAGTLRLRASGVSQSHRHRFGTTVEDDRHRTLFAEATLAGRSAPVAWIVGAALQVDDYRSRQLPGFDYRFVVPALFVQADADLTRTLALAGSARIDRHSRYGTRLSPRASLAWRPGPLVLRASASGGFFAPTPFVDETEASGLSRLAPLAGLRAETARTGSLDLGYTGGVVSAGLTLFASDIDRAVQVRTIAPDRIALVNADGVTRTRGAEASVRVRWRDLRLAATYTRVSAHEPDPDGPGRRAVPLTPRDAAGAILMWEDPKRGRAGIEAFYVGRQSLADDPYRTTGRPYLLLGVLAQARVGRVTLFANAENLLDVRQTRDAPLLLPRRSPTGSWTVDGWAPLDGRVVNAGVKVALGGPGG